MCAENVPNIKGKRVKQELKKHNFIKALELPSAGISPECSTHILFGSDIYWNFVTGETKRTPGEN